MTVNSVLLRCNKCETVNRVPVDKLIIDAFIKKPFEGSQMLSTVRRILDAEIRDLPFY